jgi:hypothetical protein
MKARDLRPRSHGVVLAIAEAAQREAIKRWLVNTYVGGARRIAPWDDHRHSLVTFYSWDVARVGPTMADVLQRRKWNSPATPLRYLKQLAAAGFLEQQQRRAGGVVAFRFSRRKCDELAAAVLEELLSEGLEREPVRSTVEVRRGA